MIKQKFIKVMAGAVALGALMFAAPAVTQAANITSVSVTIGSTTFCDLTGSCAHKIWDLSGVGDITGKALILTQAQLSQAANNYNFDTSEILGTFTPVITVNGFNFNDTTRVLNNGGSDPETTTHQEAIDWTSLGSNGGISLWVAYADTAHGGTTGSGGTCSDANHTCLPENPWAGSPNTIFLGNPVAGGCLPPGGTVVTNPQTTCFDAGALRIELAPVQTPEPSILMTLGTGMIGIAMAARKALKNRA